MVIQSFTIYESVGLLPTEHQIGMDWWERKPDGN